MLRLVSLYRLNFRFYSNEFESKITKENNTVDAQHHEMLYFQTQVTLQMLYFTVQVRLQETTVTHEFFTAEKNNLTIVVQESNSANCLDLIFAESLCVKVIFASNKNSIISAIIKFMLDTPLAW